MNQTPDPREGFYYVSCIDAGRVGLLVGPFVSHFVALAAVDFVRGRVVELEPRAWFYAFGTCRTDAPRGPGRLNDYFPELKV